MNEEDREWFNGIYPYLKMLVKINYKLDELVKDNNDEKVIEHEADIFFDLSSELIRLLPFKLDYDESKEVTMGITLVKKDGILLLKNHFDEIENDYKEIIDKYFADLVQIIKIRNKYIHEPHNIKCDCFVFGRDHAYASFKYKEENYELSTDSLVEIVDQLNNSFKKIEKKFKLKINDLDIIERDHPYIKNVIRLFSALK